VSPNIPWSFADALAFGCEIISSNQNPQVYLENGRFKAGELKQ
jgi:hypothetical protein